MLLATLFQSDVAVYITWWFLRFFDNFFSVRMHELVFACMLVVHTYR